MENCLTFSTVFISYQLKHAYQDIFCIFSLSRYVFMSYEVT